MRQLFILFLLGAAVLQSQEYRATLLGIVADPSGAKVPNATVAATNMETGVAESGQNLNRWFDTSKDIWIQQPADSLRVTPFRSPNIRRHTQPQTDMTLIRDFHVREGHKLQFKVSAFNVTNSPIFDFPNTSPTSNLFGVVPITQLNLPRSIEMAFRQAQSSPPRLRPGALGACT
jgi:hypothetical protein